MDELEALTDNELRLRLLQYGFPNIPITVTTRKTLIKKLRLYLQNADSSLQKAKDLVTKYSSDEESGQSPHRQKKSTYASIESNVFSRPSQSYARLPQSIRNSSSGSKNIYVSPVYISNDSDEETLGNSSDNMDITTDYTKRLLQLRRDNIQKTQQIRNRSTARKSENGRAYEQKEIKFGADISSSIKMATFKNPDSNGTYFQRHSFVSMLLIGFPIMFFTLIFFAYLNMSSNINTMHYSSASYTVCQPVDILFELGQQKHTNDDCIEETNIESTLKLLKIIAVKLREMYQNTSCGDGDMISLCKKDIVTLHVDDDWSKDARNIKYFIAHNPAWGIMMNGDECFSLSAPSSSLSCTVYKKVQTFFTIIGFLAILGILLFAARKLYYFLLAVKEKRRLEQQMIIDEIFALLMEKVREDRENPYLSVNHMREKIIAGKNMKISVWNEVLAQLEQNEKLLVFGYENINGEDVKVIRWLDQPDDPCIQLKNSPLKISNMSAKRSPIMLNHQRNEGNLKKWIGPAFDKCNKVTAPTNCLKIRNMFESQEVNNENLQTCIYDTIVSKVRDKGCKVIDIQLDRKTCCVYVKCANCADAGILHYEINGWWLDQKLVVVKFLKEEKYDQRFPNSKGNKFREEHDSENEF